VENEAITNANPIAVALRYWPADRFPKQDYAAFWCWKFKDYPPHVVAEAIGVLIMESDPFAPTCEEVTRILERLGMKPDVTTWEREDYLRIKAEREKIQAQQDDDDAVCNALSRTVWIMGRSKSVTGMCTLSGRVDPYRLDRFTHW